jgi:hypothetical protein
MNGGNARSVLDRLLDPISQCLGPEGALALSKLEADPVAEARIAELAEKCNEGQLTPEERSEYETYVHAGNIIAVLQAKARKYLKERAPA